MATEKEFKTNIIGEIFDINEDIEVDEIQVNYLFKLEDSILSALEIHGETGSDKIRAEIIDDLLKLDYLDLMKYLGVEIPTKVKKSIDDRLNDKSLFTIEEAETSDDLFNTYLVDDVINDLIYNLRGFDRRSIGSKEVFTKTRSSLIPTTRIMAIQNIFISLFNKTNFLSQKEDPEQAQLIMLAYKSIFDIVLEIPYSLCDTQKTIEILSMSALKLSNLIGLSKEFRKDFLKAVEESFNSDRKKNDSNNNNNQND